MLRFFKLNLLVRSDMERTMLSAAQFAHIPENQLKDFIKDRQKSEYTKYFVSTMAKEISNCYGNLCVACLCPVYESTGTCIITPWKYLPNYFYFNGFEFYNCHFTCEKIMKIIECVEQPHSWNENALIGFNPKDFKSYLDYLSKQKYKPKLRFNPRIYNTHPNFIKLEKQNKKIFY